MDSEKFKLILERLLAKTEKGELEWEKTADRDTFLLVLQDSSISITNSIINYAISQIVQVEYCSFNFRDENGNIVDSVEIEKSSENIQIFDTAKRIFELARSQSLEINRTVDSILEQLAA